MAGFSVNGTQTLYMSACKCPDKKRVLRVIYEVWGIQTGSVVVITCASHAEGPRFEPGRGDILFSIFVQTDHFFSNFGVTYLSIALLEHHNTACLIKNTSQV